MPIEYMSHWFSAPDSNYSANKRELLKVLSGLERWRHYWVDSLFVVHSDHANLQCYIINIVVVSLGLVVGAHDLV